MTSLLPALQGQRAGWKGQPRAGTAECSPRWESWGGGGRENSFPESQSCRSHQWGMGGDPITRSRRGGVGGGRAGPLSSGYLWDTSGCLWIPRDTPENPLRPLRLMGPHQQGQGWDFSLSPELPAPPAQGSPSAAGIVLGGAGIVHGEWELCTESGNCAEGRVGIVQRGEGIVQRGEQELCREGAAPAAAAGIAREPGQL